MLLIVLLTYLRPKKKKDNLLGVPVAYYNHPHHHTLREIVPSLQHTHTPQDRQPTGRSINKHPEAFPLAEQLRKISKRLNYV